LTLALTRRAATTDATRLPESQMAKARTTTSTVKPSSDEAAKAASCR